MTERELREKMVNIGLSLYNRGYTRGCTCSMSAVLPNGNLLITPAEHGLGWLKNHSLSKIKQSGYHIAGPLPSNTKDLHLAIIEKQPKFRAVIHIQSTYITALSCLTGLNDENVLKGLTPSYVKHIGTLPLITHSLDDEDSIANKLLHHPQNATAYLLSNHGAIVASKDLLSAMNKVEELEEAAKLYFLLKGCNVNYLANTTIPSQGKASFKASSLVNTSGLQTN